VDIASDAHVPETTRQLLIAVANRYGLVACVSGRRASEARAMVGVGSISYLGSHGVELLRSGGGQAVITATDPDQVPGADEPDVHRLEVLEGGRVTEPVAGGVS